MFCLCSLHMAVTLHTCLVRSESSSPDLLPPSSLSGSDLIRLFEVSLTGVLLRLDILNTQRYFLGENETERKVTLVPSVANPNSLPEPTK